MDKEVYQFIIENLQLTIGDFDLSDNQNPNIFEMGLDSFAFMQLISNLEVKFQVSFELKELMSSDFQTIAGIQKAVLEKIKDK